MGRWKTSRPSSAAIARIYDPDFVNLMSVRGDHQVQLSVVFAEVSRSGLREMGFNGLLSADGATGGWFGPNQGERIVIQGADGLETTWPMPTTGAFQLLGAFALDPLTIVGLLGALEEAIDMLQAMNTGHEGSISTIHSNSARDAVGRLESMVSMGMPNMTDKSIRLTIARALDVIVHLDRLIDGKRRLISLTEVTGMEGQVVSMQDIFRFEQKNVDMQGNVHGTFFATGTRPRFSERIRSYGQDLPSDLFRFRLEL